MARILQVYQINPVEWVVIARGFYGNLEEQSYPNEVLVPIDGRALYTMLSGVIWDLSDVLPENVDCIEVISRPSATMWGANSVNGGGAQVVRASSAAEGLEAFEQSAVEAVLSDMVMPGEMNGLEMARQIRRRNSHIPIVLMTGYSEAVGFASAEGFPLLRKPFTF